MPEQLAWTRPRLSTVQDGDMVMLVAADSTRILVRARAGQTTHTHQGMFAHDAIIGQAWGAAVLSQAGHRALVLEPALADLIRHLKRATQIIYPKDAAYIVHRLNLRAGSRVIEAGTGSAGLTTALAWAVAPDGIVYTHEARPDIFRVARQNLERVGLLPFVRMFETDIVDGFGASEVDALFLDVREPWVYLPQVRASLRVGGFFASLLPTTNQVIDLLIGLEAHSFADIAVEELLLRPYKPTPDRFRPGRHVDFAHRLSGLCPLHRRGRGEHPLAAQGAHPLRRAPKDGSRHRRRSRAARRRAPGRKRAEIPAVAAALGGRGARNCQLLIVNG
jgi:tRNA (adenine57-N1/adenine58-N1)-methyltransferase